MMASGSALDLQCGSRIEPKPQGRLSLHPRKNSRPQGPVAQSEKGRVARLRRGSFARAVYPRGIVLFTRLLRSSPKTGESRLG